MYALLSFAATNYLFIHIDERAPLFPSLITKAERCSQSHAVTNHDWIHSKTLRLLCFQEASKQLCIILVSRKNIIYFEFNEKKNINLKFYHEWRKYSLLFTCDVSHYARVFGEISSSFTQTHIFSATQWRVTTCRWIWMTQMSWREIYKFVVKLLIDNCWIGFGISDY